MLNLFKLSSIEKYAGYYSIFIDQNEFLKN